MSRRRPKQPQAFSRGRLIVGLVLVAGLAAAIAFGFRQLQSGPNAGALVYASPTGVYVHDLVTGEDRRATTLPKDTVAAIPSPDGEWVAYSKGAGEVWLSSLVKKQRYQVAEQLTLPLGWSPDGRLLIAELTGDRDLVAVEPDGKREPVARGGYSPNSTPVWLNERRFAISSAEDRFVVIDVKSNERFGEFAGTPLAASPDGKQILIAREDAVTVSKVETDEPVALRVIFEGAASTAAASRQGFLAVAAKDKDAHNGVWIFRGADQAQQVVEGKVTGIAWSTEGAALIYARKGELFALERPGAEPKRVSRPGIVVFPLSSFVVVP